uniref:Protein kinase domain-containing protein n=1 Tax=Panagrolaimus sp. JU765 TaxID=591449 RepID=A0AC34Q728_9BILA
MSKDKESRTEATNTTKTTNDKTEGQDDTKTTGTNKDLMKETSNKLVKSSKEKKSDEKKEEEKKKSVEKTAEKPTTKIENKKEKVEKKDEKVSTPVNAKTLAKEEKKEAKKEEEKKDAKEDEKKDSDAKPSKEATTPAPATNEHEDEEEFEAKEGRIKAAVDFVLKQKQIGIWEIEKVIGAGANGLVARVKHMKTGQKSVMKVALSPSSFRSLIWESEVMGRVRNAGLVGEDRTSHLVRRLGSGETAGFEGGPLPESRLHHRLLCWRRAGLQSLRIRSATAACRLRPPQMRIPSSRHKTRERGLVQQRNPRPVRPGDGTLGDGQTRRSA